jgi:hypothetical protein
LVSVLTNQYQFSIPKTKIRIKAREIIIFWAVIWSGVSGGVLVAAVISIADCIFVSKNKKDEISGAFVNVRYGFHCGKRFLFVFKVCRGLYGKCRRRQFSRFYLARKRRSLNGFDVLYFIDNFQFVNRSTGRSGSGFSNPEGKSFFLGG